MMKPTSFFDFFFLAKKNNKTPKTKMIQDKDEAKMYSSGAKKWVKVKTDGNPPLKDPNTNNTVRKSNNHLEIDDRLICDAPMRESRKHLKKVLFVST